MWWIGVVSTVLWRGCMWTSVEYIRARFVRFLPEVRELSRDTKAENKHDTGFEEAPSRLAVRDSRERRSRVGARFTFYHPCASFSNPPSWRQVAVPLETRTPVAVGTQRPLWKACWIFPELK